MVTFLRILAYVAFAVVFVVTPVVVVIGIIRAARRSTVAVGHCRGCGCDLQEVASDRCPACGRSFVRNADGTPIS